VVEKELPEDNFDQLPTTDKDIAIQMKNINKSIDVNNCNKMYNYCLIGRNLKELKKSRKGKEFITFVKNYLPSKNYGRSYIYFLIDLYEFASIRKKLMYVTVGINIIRSKFKIVKEMIETEASIWS